MNPAPGPLPPDPPQGPQPAAVPPDLRDDLERPSLKAALLLLVPAALCSGLFYLWLRKPGEAIAYGCLLGGGAAAIAAEFIKYARSLREHPEEGGGAGKRVFYLALHAFRLGFFKTFWELARELFKLAGFKVVISLVFALAAYLIARAGHWF